VTQNQLAHAEACANTIIGLVLAQLVLAAFGMPISEAVVLNVVMLAVSYARSFVLRILFSRFRPSKVYERRSVPIEKFRKHYLMDYDDIQ
jgi:hypothetical protein